MKKELRFSATVDTAGFDRTVKEMQQKLESIYKAGDRSRSQFELKQRVSQAGLGAAPTGADRDRANRDDRLIKQEMDRFIKDQMRSQEQMSRFISKQLQMKQEMLNTGKSTLDIENRINQVIEKRRISEEAVNRTLDERSRIIQQMEGGGAGQGRGGLLSRFSSTQILGGVGSAFGALATGAAVAQQVNRAPGDIMMAQGSAMSTYGRPAANVITGNAFEDVYFAQEAAKASDMSQRERQFRERASGIGLIGRIGAAGFGAAAGGGFFGGLPGAIGAGIIGAGAAALSGEDSIQNRLTGTYNSALDKRQAERYASLLESQKEMNPVQRAVIGRYQQELAPNLSIQRATGMSDSRLLEELTAGNEEGFTNQITRESMAQILSSGGSTRSAISNAGLSNRLARNFDLTNAASNIGALSSLTSTPEAGENSMIRILSLAVTKGLDDAEFVEEQRKFVDIATSVVQRSGALDGNQTAVAGGFASFVAGNQGYQVTAAKTAYELSNQLAGQSGGVTGAIKAASFNSDPALKNLSFDEKSYLMNLSPQQIRAGGNVIESLAEKSKMSVPEFQKKLIGVAIGGTQTTSTIDKTANMLRSMRGKEGTNEFRDLSSKYITEMSVFNQGVGKLTPSQQQAFVKGQVFGEETSEYSEALSVLSADVGEKARGPGTARSRDRDIRGLAAQDNAFNSTFSLFRDRIDDANSNLNKFSGEIVKAATSAKNAGEMMKAVVDNFKKMGIGAEGPSGPGLVQEKGAPPSGE